jgi:parallel beta-helix repeat protein
MTVSNCIFDNTETYLTPLDAASVSHYGMNAVMNYLKIINCRFSGYRYAIKLRDSKGGIISGCNFSDCGTPITLSGTQLDKIDNNSFYACGTAILFSDASSSFINITNNFFVAFKNAGIETASGMAGSISHVNILGNTFKDAAVTPIYLHSPGQTYINISDNHFVNISVTTKIADIINYSSIRHLNNLYDNIASGHTVSTYIKTMVNYITWDPPSFGDGLSEESPDISVIDAVEGDMVLVAPATAAYDLHGLVLSAYVSSTGNVRVVLKNGTGASRDLTSRTFRVRIIKTSD